MTVTRQVIVTGRVQGVFFRQSAANRAREIGVTGWVRNCPDGSVEVLVSGEPESVEAMIDWLRTGPPAAEVVQVQVEEVPPEEIDGFEVRRG